MNRCSHAVAFGLVGWYLMLPPAGRQNGVPWPDAGASISQWTIAESFDFAKPCETALAEHRKKALQTYKVGAKAPNVEFWNRFYLTAAGEASCIATDDPRLKQNTIDRGTEVPPSAAD